MRVWRKPDPNFRFALLQLRHGQEEAVNLQRTPGSSSVSPARGRDFQRATPNQEVPPVTDDSFQEFLTILTEIEIEWIELDPALRRQLQSSLEARGNFAKIHKSSSRTMMPRRSPSTTTTDVDSTADQPLLFLFAL